MTAEEQLELIVSRAFNLLFTLKPWQEYPTEVRSAAARLTWALAAVPILIEADTGPCNCGAVDVIGVVHEDWCQIA